MSGIKAVDFFKAPEQLVKLLGERAEELLAAWFAAAGYLRPRGWHISLFPGVGVIKKRTKAVDADLAFGMSYYLCEDDEEPSVRVKMSFFLSDEIQNDPFPTIEISSGSSSEEKLFIFRAGTWTIE